MKREVVDVGIFLFAIAKVLFSTGLGLGIAIAVIAERAGFRVVALGVEQVRSESRPSRFGKRSGQLADTATSPLRKVMSA